MATPSDKEVLGDWSNLKGTRYHLVYAVWLILKRKAARVRFFAGNDLAATPTAPPTDIALGGAVSAAAEDADIDVWVQLKATPDPWTVLALLDDNLLPNFICNAAESERRGRRWEAVLVTEADVRGGEVRAFVADRAAYPKNEAKFRLAVKQAGRLLAGAGLSPADEQVEGWALAVLGQLAGTAAVRFATLKAEIETELALAGADRASVARTASVLVGALVLDAGAGPEVRAYDRDWVNREAGWCVVSDRPFDTDVPAACDAAAGDAAAGPVAHAARPRLARALGQFLAARECAFALTGRTGAGKSWAVAEWLRTALVGRPRVLVQGAEFRPDDDLGDLAARRLGPLSDRELTPRAVLDRLLAAAAGRGPPVFVIDDLRVTQGTAQAYRDGLARLVGEGRRRGVKLVVTCQAEAWDLFALRGAFPDDELFLPSEPVADGGRPPASHTLGEFTPDELEDAVRRRLPAYRVDAVLNHLRHPALSRLRSPLLLGRYLAEVSASPDAPPPDLDTADRLIRSAVDARVDQAAAELGPDAGEVPAALDALVDELWVGRRGEVQNGQAVARLETVAPGLGRRALAAFRRAGLLASAGPVAWAEGWVADHLYSARFLGRATTALAELDPDLDATVVESAVRVAADGAELAKRLVRHDERHRAGAARGLSARPPEELRTVLTLRALTRHPGELVADPAGCEGLGVLAARGRRGAASRVAWEHVLHMFLSGDPYESIRGRVSLEAAFGYAPRRVARVIRFRIARELAAVGGRQGIGGRVAGALAPLRGATHSEAAEVALATVEAVRPPRPSRRSARSWRACRPRRPRR